MPQEEHVIILKGTKKDFLPTEMNICHDIFSEVSQILYDNLIIKN